MTVAKLLGLSESQDGDPVNEPCPDCDLGYFGAGLCLPHQIEALKDENANLVRERDEARERLVDKVRAAHGVTVFVRYNQNLEAVDVVLESRRTEHEERRTFSMRFSRYLIEAYLQGLRGQEFDVDLRPRGSRHG